MWPRRQCLTRAGPAVERPLTLSHTLSQCCLTCPDAGGKNRLAMGGESTGKGGRIDLEGGENRLAREGESIWKEGRIDLKGERIDLKRGKNRLGRGGE
jgi:hypothetical protein